MLPFIYIIVAVIAAVLIGVTIFLICYLTQKRYKDFVLKNSTCLDLLNEINNRYEFYPDICFDQYHTYDNEVSYNNISCADYLIYQLQFIRKKLFNQIKNVNINRQQYFKYIDEVKSITQFGKFKSPIGRFKLNKLIKAEKQLLEKRTYQAPITQFSLMVTLYCSTINGRIYDRKNESFSVDQIVAFNKKLNNKNGNFYNDREIWDSICRVERGKVSNRMRFSVYERDGYKCRNCGVSESYARLEIDHIIPIAKGGKSTYDNLQTLCHRCNVEKGDNLYRK